jgi:hypothetical protein
VGEEVGVGVGVRALIITSTALAIMSAVLEHIRMRSRERA